MADITVFDPATVKRGEETFVNDVPGDGYRYVRDSHGIETVIVSGAVAWTKQGGYKDACGEVLPGAEAKKVAA